MWCRASAALLGCADACWVREAENTSSVPNAAMAEASSPISARRRVRASHCETQAFAHCPQAATLNRSLLDFEARMVSVPPGDVDLIRASGGK